MIDNTGSKATKKTRHYNKTIYVEQSNKHSLTLSCYKSWPNAVRKLERASSIQGENDLPNYYLQCFSHTLPLFQIKKKQVWYFSLVFFVKFEHLDIGQVSKNNRDTMSTFLATTYTDDPRKIDQNHTWETRTFHIHWNCLKQIERIVMIDTE